MANTPQTFDLDQCLATCEDCCDQLRARGDCPGELTQCEDIRDKLRAAKGPGVQAFDWKVFISLLLTIIQSLASKPLPTTPAAQAHPPGSATSPAPGTPVQVKRP